MARKPSRMYRAVRGQAYTRKEYMGGIPNSRISQFILGNKTASFPVTISLMVKEQCQIRHTALEAARITLNRTMEKRVGQANYRIRIRVYPHMVLRENKQATGAGADRVSQGMRSSFGKIVSLAARVNKNQIIIDVETTEKNIPHAKIAMRKAGMKLPSPCYVSVNESS